MLTSASRNGLRRPQQGFQRDSSLSVQERLVSQSVFTSDEEDESDDDEEEETTDKRPRAVEDLADEYAAAASTKKARTVKPRPKLEPHHLQDASKGLNDLMHRFPSTLQAFPTKPATKKHCPAVWEQNAAYSGKLMLLYQEWMTRLFPSADWTTTATKLDRLASKQAVKSYLDHLRAKVRSDHVLRVYGLERGEALLQELEQGLLQEQETEAAPPAQAEEDETLHVSEEAVVASPPDTSTAEAVPVTTATVSPPTAPRRVLVDDDEEDEAEWDFGDIPFDSPEKVVVPPQPLLNQAVLAEDAPEKESTADSSQEQVAEIGGGDLAAALMASTEGEPSPTNESTLEADDDDAQAKDTSAKETTGPGGKDAVRDVGASAEDERCEANELPGENIAQDDHVGMRVSLESAVENPASDAPSDTPVSPPINDALVLEDKDETSQVLLQPKTPANEEKDLEDGTSTQDSPSQLNEHPLEEAPFPTEDEDEDADSCATEQAVILASKEPSP